MPKRAKVNANNTPAEALTIFSAKVHRALPSIYEKLAKQHGLTVDELAEMALFRAASFLEEGLYEIAASESGSKHIIRSEKAPTLHV